MTASAAAADAPTWAVPGVDAGNADPAPVRPVEVATSAQTRVSVLTGLRCTCPHVVTVADAVAVLVDQHCRGELGAAAQLNDDLIALGR